MFFFEDAALSKLSVKQVGGSWSRYSRMPSSAEEYADLVAFGKQIEELKAKNDDLLSRRVGEKKAQMDTLLKLCSEIKKSSGLESKKRS